MRSYKFIWVNLSVEKNTDINQLIKQFLNKFIEILRLLIRII